MISENPTSGITDSESEASLPLTREALYALVWAESMLKVAARFGVSSSYLARVCTRLNVPRPERGYWAKLAVGQRVARPALPEARPGDELVWSREGERVTVPRPRPRPPEARRKKAVARPAAERTRDHLLNRG